MYTKTKNKRRIFGAIGAAAVVFMALISLSGCVSGYGSLKQDSEITQTFLSKQIVPDHQYYYIGRSSIPYAVIGVHRSYKLKSKLWEEIDVTSDQLNQLIDRMWGRGSASGAYILDSDGKKIGVWYSKWDYTVIKLGEANQVLISSPYEPRSEGP